MSQDLWSEVDRYLTEKLIPVDPILKGALSANAAAGLPVIDVAPNQGKLLYLLARLQGAKRILEIGTLGAYSTIWLARALPADGAILSLEFEVKHAEVARANLKRVNLACSVEVRQGAALDSLAQLDADSVEPFDLIFIDADKENYPGYLEWSLRLSRVGTVIIGDNVIRDGAIVDSRSGDPRVQGVRRFLEMMASDPRLSATALQTVGAKGYDGFSLAIVNYL
jgi:predicted O-methyltransferase YrrM